MLWCQPDGECEKTANSGKFIKCDNVLSYQHEMIESIRGMAQSGGVCVYVKGGGRGRILIRSRDGKYIAEK